MVEKNIKIEEDVWWKLNKLKLEWKLKRLSDVLSRIIKEGYEEAGEIGG